MIYIIEIILQFLYSVLNNFVPSILRTNPVLLFCQNQSDLSEFLIESISYVNRFCLNAYVSELIGYVDNLQLD